MTDKFWEAGEKRAKGLVAAWFRKLGNKGHRVPGRLKALCNCEPDVWCTGCVTSWFTELEGDSRHHSQRYLRVAREAEAHDDPEGSMDVYHQAIEQTIKAEVARLLPAEEVWRLASGGKRG